jgi:uncharacterized membrane protein HdeD (DUF308 family)
MSDPNPISASLASGFEHLHRAWGWFVALGAALIILGVVCILGEIETTLITVIVLGWLLLISGVIALVHAFRTRTWSGFFLYLASAVLRVVTGYLLIRYPLLGALTLTLLLATLFIVGGVFRAVGAASLRFPRWGWTAASGAIGILLGVLLLSQLPTSSLWFLGLAVGIDLVFEGSALMALGGALRRRAALPAVSGGAAAMR